MPIHVLIHIPSGPQKCFHFSEINNSVTNCSKIMRSVLFYYLYDLVSIVNSFFIVVFIFYEQLSKKLEYFFFFDLREIIS